MNIRLTDKLPDFFSKHWPLKYGYHDSPTECLKIRKKKKKKKKVSVLAFSAGTPGGGIYGDAENFGSRHKPMIRL